MQYMAILDKSLIPIMGENAYYSLLSKMTLQEGKDAGMKQNKALKKVNKILIAEGRSPYTESWAKKYWQ